MNLEDMLSEICQSRRDLYSVTVYGVTYVMYMEWSKSQRQKADGGGQGQGGGRGARV